MHYKTKWHYFNVTESRLALDCKESMTIHQYTLIYFGDQRTRSGAASALSLFNSQVPHVVQKMNHFK